jgi:phytoene dehydrogenase-like protein
VSTAAVVGSGPNGLAAAITLAQAGVDVTVHEAADTVGGGTRSAELLEAGVVHDVCSAIHPFGAASPFFRSLGLEDHGLRWRHPDIALAHPVDDARVGVLHRLIDETASALGADGRPWTRTFGPLARDFDKATHDILGPLVRVPRHPLVLARFGVQALQPAALVARRWRTDEARALYAGIAAHSFQPLGRPTTAAAGAMLTGAAHAVGWPVAEGGSQAIADALASKLTSLGGSIVTGSRVAAIADLAPVDVVLLDTAPDAAITVVGDDMPARVRRAFRRWRFGPGAFKVDLIVEDGVPWTHDACRRAGTVHCGGTFEEVNEAETGLHAGRRPERPFVLVAQQYLADPGRSNGNHHPIWAYAHVPRGDDSDATDAVLDQIERFAPGFRDRVVAVATLSPSEFEAYDANYVGGDIAAGENSPRQTIFRPRPALDPYRISDRAYLCSAATPPGAGVHGMAGYHAARSALRRLGAR